MKSARKTTLSSQFNAVMTVSRFGSTTAYSKMTFSIDRIDKMPMKISYPGFLSSLRFLSMAMSFSSDVC